LGGKRAKDCISGLVRIEELKRGKESKLFLTVRMED
jgi:hypothetical protein